MQFYFFEFMERSIQKSSVSLNTLNVVFKEAQLLVVLRL